MTTPLAKIIKDKVTKYADLLGIGDYSYKINLVTSSKNKRHAGDCVYATVAVDEETREVFIEINKRLLIKKPKEVDKTIIHELLHVRFNELLNFTSMILDKYVRNKKARDTFDKQLELLEHKIIVPLMEALNNNGKKQRN